VAGAFYGRIVGKKFSSVLASSSSSCGTDQFRSRGTSSVGDRTSVVSAVDGGERRRAQCRLVGQGSFGL
jgi:hypothetical protein